jgi:guanylate kinase
MAKKGREPIIVVLSAPSGSGKTSIVAGLLNEMDSIARSVSYTTRSPREGEKDGEDYIFVSKEEFESMRDSGEFLECEENFGNYYGTSRRQIEQMLDKGLDVIMSIDVKGARTAKKEYPESISVFIMPPSIQELENRLRRRKTDEEIQVELRLRESKQELAASDEYDFLVVNNKLDEAVAELKQVIERERENRDRINKKAEK